MLLMLALACNPAAGPAATAPDEEEEQLVDEDEEETIESEEAPRVYRLTHAQWEHSVQALLNLEDSTGLSSGFIGTTMNGGYDNNTETLLVDAILFQDYQRVAIELSDQVARDPELLAAVAPDLTAETVDVWLEAMVSEAWRRPITTDELSSWSSVFAMGPELVGSGDDLADGVQVVLQALLQSPGFVYRMETGDSGEPLDGWEAAAKLSYTLWDKPPDAELLADVDSLADAAVLQQHAERMLADASARTPLLALFEQTLRFEDYANIEKDYDWETSLRDDMRTEGELFLTEVLFEERGGLSRLLTADFTVANASLGELYGVDGLGDEFEKVSLDGTQRAGMLTLTGFLTLMAEDEQSNPIRRGGFILHKLLCIEVPPPPDETTGVGPMEEGLSNRERVERHTGEGTCGEGCHTLINPLGYAFENYDGLGRWRTVDYGVEVDASDTFVLDGAEIAYDNAIDLVGAMAVSPQVHECFAEHVVEYTHGRSLVDSDEPVVDALTEASLGGASVIDLVTQAVTADSFRVNP